MTATADRDEFATKADLAGFRADICRTSWIQGPGIFAVIGGFIAVAAALKLS